MSDEGNISQWNMIMLNDDYDDHDIYIYIYIYIYRHHNNDVLSIHSDSTKNYHSNEN